MKQGQNVTLFVLHVPVPLAVHPPHCCHSTLNLFGATRFIPPVTHICHQTHLTSLFTTHLYNHQSRPRPRLRPHRDLRKHCTFTLSCPNRKYKRHDTTASSGVQLDEPSRRTLSVARTCPFERFNSDYRFDRRHPHIPPKQWPPQTSPLDHRAQSAQPSAALSPRGSSA